MCHLWKLSCIEVPLRPRLDRCQSLGIISIVDNDKVNQAQIRSIFPVGEVIALVSQGQVLGPLKPCQPGLLAVANEDRRRHTVGISLHHLTLLWQCVYWRTVWYYKYGTWGVGARYESTISCFHYLILLNSCRNYYSPRFSNFNLHTYYLRILFTTMLLSAFSLIG